MAEDANPFESLQSQIDEAAAYLDIGDDVIERLKYPERVLETNLTIELDDGSLERFKAFRSQFNGDRGPYKGHPISPTGVTGRSHGTLRVDGVQDRDRRHSSAVERVGSSSIQPTTPRANSSV